MNPRGSTHRLVLALDDPLGDFFRVHLIARGEEVHGREPPVNARHPQKLCHHVLERVGLGLERKDVLAVLLDEEGGRLHALAGPCSRGLHEASCNSANQSTTKRCSTAAAESEALLLKTSCNASQQPGSSPPRIPIPLTLAAGNSWHILVEIWARLGTFRLRGEGRGGAQQHLS